MLMCKEATRLISEGLDRRLSLWQRISLRLHVMMCDACAAYKRQVEGIQQLLQWRLRPQAPDESPEGDPLRLSFARRQQIRQLIRTHAADRPD